MDVTNESTFRQAERCLEKMRLRHRRTQVIGSNIMSKAAALKEQGTLVVHGVDNGGSNGEERHWIFTLPRGKRKLRPVTMFTIPEAARIFFDTYVDTGTADELIAIEDAKRYAKV